MESDSKNNEKKKRNQRVADKNEVRGSDPRALQSRNLLVKIYKVRSSEPFGNTVTLRSSYTTGNKTILKFWYHWQQNRFQKF